VISSSVVVLGLNSTLDEEEPKVCVELVALGSTLDTVIVPNVAGVLLEFDSPLELVVNIAFVESI